VPISCNWLSNKPSCFAHGKSYVSTHSPTKPTENRLNERQPFGDNARQTKRKDLEARAWQRSGTDETWRNRSYAGAKACACGRAEQLRPKLHACWTSVGRRPRAGRGGWPASAVGAPPWHGQTPL
jgi:hypothetical protein